MPSQRIMNSLVWMLSLLLCVLLPVARAEAGVARKDSKAASAFLSEYAAKGLTQQKFQEIETHRIRSGAGKTSVAVACFSVSMAVLVGGNWLDCIGWDDDNFAKMGLKFGGWRVNMGPRIELTGNLMWGIASPSPRARQTAVYTNNFSLCEFDNHLFGGLEVGATFGVGIKGLLFSTSRYMNTARLRIDVGIAGLSVGVGGGVDVVSELVTRLNSPADCVPARASSVNRVN